MAPWLLDFFNFDAIPANSFAAIAFALAIVLITPRVGSACALPLDLPLAMTVPRVKSAFIGAAAVGVGTGGGADKEDPTVSDDADLRRLGCVDPRPATMRKDPCERNL